MKDQFILTNETLPLIKHMAEQMPGGFFIYREDKERGLIYANHVVLDIYGCESLEEFQELTGNTFEGMVYREDFEKIQASIDSQIENDEERALDYVQYRIVRKDGSIRWVDDYGHFAHSDDFGDIYYVFISDITEQFEARREVRRRSEVIEGVSHDYNSIYLLDLAVNEMHAYRIKNDYLQSIIQDLKRSGVENIGWNEVMPEYAERYVVPEDREMFLRETASERIQKRMKDESTYTVDYRIDMLDGQYCFMQMMVIRIEGSQFSNHAVVGIRDVTEQVERVRRETEEFELESERRMNESKNTFLSNISHDIRTPMNSILGFTALARKHINDPEVAGNYLDKANESGEHLLMLIDDLLEMSQLESGNTHVHLTKCDLASEIEAIGSLMSIHINKKKQTLETDVLRQAVWIDELRFRRIMFNLVDNAVKFTPEGGKIRISVSKKGVSKSGFARFRIDVEDNGIGMDEDFIEKAFVEFERERTSTKSGFLGTGLGLSVVQKLLDIMGGSISVKSKKGEGSVFTVFLPLRLAEGEIPEKLPQALEDFKDDGQHRILLVEDIEINRILAETILTESGFLVESVEDGCDAVEAIRRSPENFYDLVLMDIQMPIMNGYEATRAIRALDRADVDRLPILALSANARAEDRRMSFESGMNLHIAKPFDAEDMVKKISNILEDA